MTGSRRLVRRYYLFRTTNSAGFYLPVAVLFLQDRGFGPGFAGLAYAVFGFGTLAAETLGPVGLLPRAGVPVAVTAAVLWVLASPVRSRDRPDADVTAADGTGASD